MRIADFAPGTGATRISRICVPSGCSACGTRRQTRTCSESVTGPHPAAASVKSRAVERNQRMAQTIREPPRPLHPALALRRPYHQVCGMTMPPNTNWASPNAGLQPHAFDPIAQPELFEGVRTRRAIAFAIDLLIIGVPLAFLGMFIFVFGLVTLGLGWF